MLESLVASLLNRFLGSYVQNFDPKQLNIGIWSGDVKLRDLELKKEALDEFKLPVDVIKGHLGELVLQIPWSNLKNKPVKIVIEDVYLLAVPNLSQPYDAEDEEARAQALKKERLESFELLDKNVTAGMTEEEIQKNQSFTDSLVTKIVDNLQITIKNIHIRYEDKDSVPGHPYSLGATLHELSAVSTDGEWNPIFIQNATAITKKLATLSALSLYWNTDSELLCNDEDLTTEKFIEQCRKSIPTNHDDLTESNQYILRPVSGVGKITMNKHGTTATTPKLAAQLIFDDLGFVFDSDQYRDALWTADLFHLYMKTREFKRYRPQVEVSKDPRAWFKYAGEVVLSQIHQKRKEWSWEYIERRHDDRLKYIELYKKSKTAGSLPPEDQELFDGFEKELDYDDLRFYRTLAKSELRKERAFIELQQKQQAQQQQSQAGGWYTWLWGTSAAGTASSEQTEEQSITTLTDEQKKELYDAIEWDEKQALSGAIDIPKDRITMEIETALETGSFSLKVDPHGANKDLAVISFNGFKANFYNRPDSFLTNISLQELRVDDKTNTSLYQQVVSVKKLESSPQDVDKDNEEDSDAFFWLSFEHNPLDESADSKLNAKLKSITVYYNVAFIETIHKFFKPPKTHLETIGAIMNAAGATVEGLRDQTRLGLEYALQEHKTIDIKMDLQAPLIVVPLDSTRWESPCAIIDAGHISIVSDLVSRDVLEEVKAKRTQQYSESDWKKLENLMYDKFNLRLHSTQFLLGPTVRETMRQLDAKNAQNPAYVIDRINMDFLVEISILPEAHSLTKFKVSGNLPVFRASMSDIKYQTLMQIIDKSIPNFDDEESDSGTQTPVTNGITRDRSFSLLGERPILEDVPDNDDTATLVSGAGSTAPGSASSSGTSDQKIFEFDFKVDTVNLALFRSTNKSTFEQEQLVDLNLEQFSLSYYFKPSEMFADVTLSSLSIEDFIDQQSTPNLRKFVTSHPGVVTKDLFNVQYWRMKRENSEKELFDQKVEISLSTLQFILEPKSSLTLLDFIITTFTKPNQSNNQHAIGDGDDNTIDDSGSLLSTDEHKDDSVIDVKVNLSSIILVLNDEGIKLATLKLDSAVVGVRLVSETMNIESRIGSLTLHDDIDQGTRRDSMLRQLISIEGDDLAHFKYQTFTPEKVNELNYNSSVYFRAGSIRLNVVEEPLSKIFKFLMRLNQMKGLYDAARQAALNQANQIEDAAKIHLDVLVKTPILVFPKPSAWTDEVDLLTAQLGEIYLENKFETLEETTANILSAGIRSTRLTSEFYFENMCQKLEIIDNLDIALGMTYLAPAPGLRKPALTISATMPNVELKLTELQYQYLMELSRTLPGAFDVSGLEENEFDELEEELRTAKNLGVKPDSSAQLSTVDSPEPTQNDKMDFSFHIDSIGLYLFHNTAETTNDQVQKACSLSSFILNEAGVSFKMKGDSSWESDVHIHSFTVNDTRTEKDNKFNEIIPSIDHDESQFMCRATFKEGHTDLMLTVDSPKMILAIDYLLALKEFAELPSTVELEEDVDEEELDNLSQQESAASSTLSLNKTSSTNSNLSFHVNIVDAYLIILANPSVMNSEAIVFKTDQLVLSQRSTTTVSVSKVGMFLCQMDRFDDLRLRVLDDFSVTASMDNRNADATHFLSSVQIAVEPLVLRLSLRDMLLASDIISRASKLANAKTAIEDQGAPQSPMSPKYSRFRRMSQFAKSSRMSAAKSSRSKPKSKSTRGIGYHNSGTNKSNGKEVTVIRGEELNAEFEGFRFIAIGKNHEIPIIDFCVKPFAATIQNWSSDLKLDMSAETFTNVYNVEKSVWEPLIETWDIGLHVSKTPPSKALFVSLISRKLMDITLTSQTISLLNKSLEYVNENKDNKDLLTRPRDSGAPYRVRNETGFPIEVSADTDDSKSQLSQDCARVEDGEEIPWRFFDWAIVRENLSSDMQNVHLRVKLLDSPYETVKNISVTSVGEHYYILQPKTHNVLHRLVCEINIENDLKKIIMRSALKLQNNSQVDVELNVVDTDIQWRLQPGESRAVPIQYCYDKPFRFRPQPALGFDWSSPIEWKTLQSSSPSIPCGPLNSNESTPFYFQVDAKYDKLLPLNRVYPNMTVVLSAPVEIVNLLPFDFSYRIYDKNVKKDWSNFVKKGGTSPVHVVQLSHLLLLSVHPKEAGYDQTDFAIVLSSNDSQFKQEKFLTTRSPDGQKLKLRLHYFNQADSGTGYQVVVYSPYLVLNKTGLDLQVKTRTNIATSKVSSVSLPGAQGSMKRALPKMWSFENDDRTNRALLRVGDSRWSGPQSFEALGSDYEVVIPSSNNQYEISLGVNVSEGHGKYKLTKIVTISPRFVIKNNFQEDIQFRDPNSSHLYTVSAGSIEPIHFMRQSDTKQLNARFINSDWSAPFNISNVGKSHVKLITQARKYVLLQVDTILENATLYLHVSNAGKNWPFSIRNFTNLEFIFFQTNPYVDEQGAELSSHPRFDPIRYRVPGKSVMPYSWDYPAAPVKEIMIQSNGKQRRVQLAEIGNLQPMKVPHLNTVPGGIVDLNVVADGPTQTLVLTDYSPENSLYRLKTNASLGSTASSSQVEVFSLKEEEDKDVVMNINIKFEGVGISLINRRLMELCYVTLRGFEFNFRSSELFDTFSVKMKWIQIDNQLYGGIYPIILFPSVIPKSGREIESHPTFSASITRVKDESHGVLYIKHATMLLQQMTLEIDEDFLFALMEFAKSPGSDWTGDEADKLCDESLDIPQPNRDTSGLDVYFEVLHIQPAQMDLSFVRTERVNVEDRPSADNAIMFFFNILTMAIGNINDAPVRLNALIMENVRTPLPLLYQSIGTHYSQEFLYQVHKILGSADFIGNPVGLFNNLSSGFMDIFYEPYQGYILNDRPQELGIGLAKGGVSFMKKSIFGVSDSISKVTGSISKGLSVATMDENFQNKRRMKMTRNKPKHALYGLASGANSLFEGITSGVSGLALNPMEGASREGAAGFFKGLGKGLVGLPTKTAIGLFDFANNVSEGVRNTTTVFDADAIDKVRPARFIGKDGIVRPYSMREAIGQSWLKQVENGNYFNDNYLAHISMSGDEMIVMVTFERIMLMSNVKMTVEWEVPLQDLQTIAMERTGLALIIRGGIQGPFIPVSDTTSRRFLFKQIGVAVNQFNRLHQMQN
ncbi:intermembrane lipid transfer protein Vps13p [Trichomonascus vanleenenianus]|uniref:membrane morphogenesis protein VPS13 n=1 Tax=Trichomonascus vanleenenianus TaxID=2268995 RepID=UPI003ECBA1F9